MIERRFNLKLKKMVLKAFILAVTILSVVSESCASMVFTLHRFSPPNSPLELEEVRAQDESRHSTVPKYSLKGFGNPWSNGVYYTTVKLGTPAQELSVVADTGSSVLWVNCKPCSNCPESNAAGISKDLSFFDVTTSSTASFDSCSNNPKCSTMMNEQTEDGCATEDKSRCKYRIGYLDGTMNEGYYITDLSTYTTVYPGVATTSASIYFGCGFNQSGKTMPKGTAGILGLGQEKYSILSQLHKQGVTPNVLSHCLRGDANGGGTLVLGEATTPNMVYTKLLKSGEGNYPVHMESVSVDGTLLPIKYASSDRKVIIVDSGTTLTYVWPEVYDPFVSAITSFAAKSGVPSSPGKIWSHCFSVSSSANEIFPQVRLNFSGGASMVLHPKDYLIQPAEGSSDNRWCIGFQKADTTGVAILGDLVLKDKIIVYDIARQRIGMASYDCSLPLRISTTSGANASDLNMLSIAFIGVVTLLCCLL